jgi:hypothetical protein
MISIQLIFFRRGNMHNPGRGEEALPVIVSKPANPCSTAAVVGNVRLFVRTPDVPIIAPALRDRDAVAIVGTQCSPKDGVEIRHLHWSSFDFSDADPVLLDQPNEVVAVGVHPRVDLVHERPVVAQELEVP